MIVSTAFKYHDPSPICAKITREDIGGARVVFVNMPLRESAPPNCAPTGIAILAARLSALGVRVSCVDLNAYRVGGRLLNFDEAKNLLSSHFQTHGEPHVVALSGMVTTLRWQEWTAKAVRALLPDVFLVSGGGLATEFREGLFSWIPELDGIAHSEGDEVISKIVYDAVKTRELGRFRAESSGRLLPYLRGEIGGKSRFVYDGGRPKNLDSTPYPDYSVLGAPILETYLVNPIWGSAAGNSSAAPFTMQRSINTISSRGCPFDCHFCFRGATGERKYGEFSAPRFADEMRHLVETYGVDFIGVFDDNFMVHRKRIFEMEPLLAPLVAKGLRWGTHGRLDAAADLSNAGVQKPLRVESMRRSGCVYIGFGAESADQKTLTSMGKGGFILTSGVEKHGEYEFPKTMIDGVVNTKNAGIHANLTWILGYPGEGLRELQTSLAFMEWQEQFYRSCGDARGTVNKKMFVATAYPGTEMFSHPRVRGILSQKFGIKFDDKLAPVCDDNLRAYVLELDDATKLLSGSDGSPVYFGDMPEDQFLRVRELVEAGRNHEILGMGGCK